MLFSENGGFVFLDSWQRFPNVFYIPLCIFQKERTKRTTDIHATGRGGWQFGYMLVEGGKVDWIYAFGEKRVVFTHISEFMILKRIWCLNICVGCVLLYFYIQSLGLMEKYIFIT